MEKIHVSDKRRAYFVTLSDAGQWVLAIVTENEPGYNAVKPDSDVGGAYHNEIEATDVADVLNKRLGLDKREAALIVASSIRVSDVQRDDSSIARRPHGLRSPKR